MFNPFDLMKKAGEMQNILQNLNLEGMRTQAEAGGGLVKVIVNGRMEMVDLILDPIAVDNRDVKMLQDLIISAQNEANRRMFDEVKNKIASELGIPGLAGLNI
ncbi:MAG: YbaB/EbfC family nucleoid-associated protein [Treponemataceae bacterium]